jgi:hypothetical protein
MSCFAWAGSSRGKVTDLSIAEARKADGGNLLWWPRWCLLQLWGRSTIVLLLLFLRLLFLLVLWVMALVLLLRTT